MTLTVGSMCSGYGGLEMGLGMVLDIDVRWHAEFDKAPSMVLEAHHPDIPNLRDITTVDWGEVEPVDIVTAGFPCQDLSYAGKGAGITEGTRSGLWTSIARAVRVLRPRYLALENVAAIVARRPGLDVVLADLAALGFDAEWACVRASDVGAPHQRDRWFCVAAHPGRERHGRGQDGGVVGGLDRGDAGEARERERAWAVAGDRGDEAAADAHDAADDRERSRTIPRGRVAPAAVPDGGRREERSELHGEAERAEQRTRGGHAGGRGEPAADANGAGQQRYGRPEPRGRIEPGGAAARWGKYALAIRRWERVTGCPAPVPTVDLGRGPRLNPRLSEWMMGLPEGHVTDPLEADLSSTDVQARNRALQVIGNGVVPQQAAVAISHLVGRF